MKKQINDIRNIEYWCHLFEKYEGLLTQTQRQAFKLYFYEDLSYAEVAQITATTRSAAYDSVNKAMKKLEKIANSTTD
ncbi:sigma factor-like helix-turn-helix DNA-binding protein [Mycoplasma tauri]|uniref:Sigma-70, region 4 n=1 Tax=Mycoplasma tauri TaxID=547987 RepID=A0A953T9C9_9MOLU|nr:sigma factor-like helix-turn-helix DNA-binding protein [Mycoplasma tauri]MBZ4195134.1 hypothetical protein [Mycoplasma tauri]MBZ4203669.1 hypothetical protein [Mycoplasma tauri]MBZ4204267.1 hypothetical protein [Mycoplasma tauri]MBZ4212409.1 hypothetical protein [Mycoplasma tauri]MBZ4218163.1 hypothetical protein [Mycoplasma tauri]